MKHISEDPDVQNAHATNAELSAKLEIVEKEIAAFFREQQTGQPEQPQDPVAAALKLEPGVSHEVPVRSDRFRVLSNQADALKRALRLHNDVIFQAERKAGYKVFAANAKKYMADASSLLGLIDILMATNEALRKEHQAMCERGASDAPLIQFPDYDLHQQLPVWRDSLEERLFAINHLIKVHSP